MTHTITYNSTDGIIELKVQGDLTLISAKEIASELVQLVKAEHCFLILHDLREVTIELSTLDIYELPTVFSEIVTLGGFEIDKLKRAFVAPKGQEDVHFFETVSVNRMQNVKYFFDVDEAKKWLLGK